MGVTDVPQWLLPAFVRSAKAAGATAPDEQIAAAGSQLIELWSSPDRRFHNLRHVTDMLTRLDEIAEETHNPAIMRLAVWYHGCVFSIESERTYRSNGGEDEQESATYAAQSLQSLGLPTASIDRICLLILNLKRHSVSPDDVDAMALSDIDLGVLSIEPQAYKRYRALVREEYAHIPTEDYLRARKAIVTKLLAREHLFSSPMGQRWEQAARQNLTAELQVLSNELESYTAIEPEAQPDPSELVAADSTTPAVPVQTEAEPNVANVPASAASAATGQIPPVSEPIVTEPEPIYENSMESCAHDIDRLDAMPRSSAEALKPAATEPASEGKPAEMTRQEKIELERARMQECLRRKTAEAKELREARTGEFAPIQEEIITPSSDEN